MSTKKPFKLFFTVTYAKHFAMRIYLQFRIFAILFLVLSLQLSAQDTATNAKPKSQSKADNQFHVGLTIGKGANLTHLNKEVTLANRVGNVLVLQPSVQYRWNDTWALEFVGGLHVKGHKISVDRFFFYDHPSVNYYTTESSISAGLHLHFRKPLNAQKSVYLGGTLGYGKFWQTYVGESGGSSCFNPTTGLPSFSANIPEDCDKSMEVNTNLQSKNLAYLLLGLDMEILLKPDRASESPILRFSLVDYGSQAGLNYPLRGDMQLYEGTELVHDVEVHNTGSFWAFEVGYLLPIGL